MENPFWNFHLFLQARNDNEYIIIYPLIQPPSFIVLGWFPNRPVIIQEKTTFVAFLCSSLSFRFTGKSLCK